MKKEFNRIYNWMKKNHFPVFVLGIVSTVWFLVRVIPKPSRANYPCMRVAAPFMSAFVIYLLSLGGITLALKKVRKNLLRSRYLAALVFAVIAFVGLLISVASDTSVVKAQDKILTGTEDGPNQPIGTGTGIFPGRVVWAWDKNATNENCQSNFDTKDWYFKPANTDQAAVSNMFSESVNKLTGKINVAESWDALFRFHNSKKGLGNKGYSRGEKIFIKINQTTARGNMPLSERKNGNYDYPESLPAGQERKKETIGAVETAPAVVLEILRELVKSAGVAQQDIFVGDPQNPTYGHNFRAWSAEFPEVNYIEKNTPGNGRTPVIPTEKELIFYSDKSQADKLYDVIENASYLINVASLKPHAIAGITLCAKNHFGSQSNNSAAHLHYSLIAPGGKGIPTNTGYRKYRALVDLLGSRYLGQNTMLNVVDGLFGGGSSELGGPVKYFMPPFNNDFSSSIFISQDPVAIESVCFDFLRTEWNGKNVHSSNNNKWESLPNWYGVDDYLHQAADRSRWPDGIIYDPDNTGKPIGCLGIHEHWNNAADKQYSRNMGKASGIELVSIPDTLVKQKSAYNPGAKKIVLKNGAKIKSHKFYAALTDKDNVKYFLSEEGIISFDGSKWALNTHRKVSSENLKDFKYDISSYGPELWIATPVGATVAGLPMDARSGATTYQTENTTILSDNVLAVAVGDKMMRWFGTDKGISCFRNKIWLKGSYQRTYPESQFKDYPITCMSTSPDGDSLYAGTRGGGVIRVFRNKVDAISGASSYAQWGPILMPSDTVNCLYIDKNVQWFGTSRGVARHTGYNTLENWSEFTMKDGISDNCIQAITSDKKGNIWAGTSSGISIFDGQKWKSITKNDGLPNDNILCITVDNKGQIWFGTDNGIISFFNGVFTYYN